MWTLAKFLILFLTVLKATVFCDPSLGGSAQFAADLYRAVREGRESENIVISPYSIKTSLGLLLTAAVGRTSTEILDALQLFDKSKLDIVQSFTETTEYCGNQSVVIANKLFTNADYLVNPNFNEIVRAAFNAEVEPTDFSNSLQAAETINSWIKKQIPSRDGNIDKMYAFKNSSGIVLANTAYSHGIWKTSSGQAHSTANDFWFDDSSYAIPVDMICTKVRARTMHIPELESELIIIPFGNSNLSMSILYPYSTARFDHVGTKLLNFDCSRLKAEEMGEEEVELYLPEFEIKTSITLSEILPKLGIKTIFSEDANLGNLIESNELVSLSEVIHTAYIKIDEEDDDETKSFSTTFRSIPDDLFRNIYKEFSDKSYSSLLGSVAYYSGNKPMLTIDRPFYFSVGNEEEIFFMGSLKSFANVKPDTDDSEELKHSETSDTYVVSSG